MVSSKIIVFRSIFFSENEKIVFWKRSENEKRLFNDRFKKRLTTLHKLYLYDTIEITCWSKTFATGWENNEHILLKLS